MNCRICGQDTDPFMSFGKMPIANGFLMPDQYHDEYFFELAPVYCPNCSTFQLLDQPDPKMMFHDEYAFFSRTSNSMVQHFKSFASSTMRSYLEDEDPLVVEIGSNDGILIGNFAEAGIRHVGVEPSANVADKAREYGINTVVDFFCEARVEKIISEYGYADVVMAANVMCHIPDLHAVATAVANLLKPKGVFVFEDPYLGSMIEKGSYDQIYDEHVYIFSATAVANIFGAHGFDLVDVEAQITHGGSMRYTLARKGERSITAAVAEQIRHEQYLGLNKAVTYSQFRIRCENNRDRLVELLKEKRREGQRVVGYAATSKSTTVLNYCGIGPDLIEYISDTTPIKQGKYTPGTHIPVKAYAEFQSNYPDYAVLFAWNHETEILANEMAYMESGGQWILFVPNVGVR